METKTFLMTSSYYPPYHIGGDATHVKYLSEELVKQGHEVHVMFNLDAYRYKKPGFKGFLKEIEESNGVSLHPIQSPLGKSDIYLTYFLGKSPFVKNRFVELLREIKPDIVHHHNIFSLGFDILKKHGDYVNLYTAHDYWLICQRYDLMKSGWSECEQKRCVPCIISSKKIPQVWRGFEGFKQAIRYIDTIIAPSNYMKERLSEELPLENNIVHISNFIPSPPNKIEYSGYSNYFLYVGVLEAHKGICNLLKVFKEHNKNLDAKLILVGKGSLEKKIEKYIAENKLEYKISLLGWVSDKKLWSLYNDAIAIIVPSIWPENNPMVALEALSFGTSVTGTYAGGLPEIIEKINSKLLFRFNDLEKMTRILVEYRKNSDSEELAKKIYEIYYSSASYFEKYNKILGTL